MKKVLIISVIAFISFITSCSKDGDINVFTVQDDINFGRQLDSTIMSDPSEYPILDPNKYPEAYEYIEGIMNRILESDEIYYKDDFKWQVRIIDKNVLNAFAAPGGYLYFYTGFIRYAASEAELAGVMAHEIAHADHRHSTERLTKVYGIQVLLSILIGNNPSMLEEIAMQMATGGAALKFSREDESESDESSVRYLYDIRNSRNYHPTAILDFFDRMNADSLSAPNGRLEILRTHPYDDNRRANVYRIWNELGKPEGEKFEASHNEVVLTLP